MSTFLLDPLFISFILAHPEDDLECCFPARQVLKSYLLQVLSKRTSLVSMVLELQSFRIQLCLFGIALQYTGRYLKYMQSLPYRKYWEENGAKNLSIYRCDKLFAHCQLMELKNGCCHVSPVGLAHPLLPDILSHNLSCLLSL